MRSSVTEDTAEAAGASTRLPGVEAPDSGPGLRLPPGVGAPEAGSDLQRFASERRATLPAAHYGRQLAAVMRLELRRAIHGRQTRAFLLFAAVSTVPFIMQVLFVSSTGKEQELGGAISDFAQLYQAFVLRFLCFLGTALVFAHAVREELIGRTLHYYFLVPMPRWTVLAGKYLGGFLLVGLVMTTVVTVQHGLFMSGVSRGGGLEYFLEGGGLRYWAAYMGVTLLGVAAYGAVFTALGVAFRNPTVSILLLFGWEWLVFLLPPFLKHFSVVYHLQSLCPVAIHEGPLAVLAEPTPAWLAVTALLGLSSAALVAGVLRMRRLEVQYDGA